MNPKSFSVRELSTEFGVSHVTLLSALKRCNIPTGRGVKVTIRQAFDALTKRADKHGDLASERLRKMRAEARLAELKAARMDGSVIKAVDSESAAAIALGILDRTMRQALCNDLPAITRGLDEAGIRRENEAALERSYEVARIEFAKEIEKAQASGGGDE